MDCVICRDLEHTFERAQASYMAARSAAYYRVSADFAAKNEVDMERARTDVQEHRLVCPSYQGPTENCA